MQAHIDNGVLYLLLCTVLVDLCTAVIVSLEGVYDSFPVHQILPQTIHYLGEDAMDPDAADWYCHLHIILNYTLLEISMKFINVLYRIFVIQKLLGILEKL